MGDSDDEFDRRGRGRDKFRGERNDFQRRDDRRGADDNKWGGGRDNRADFDRGRRFSPARNDGSPPQKRMRGEDGGAELGPGASKSGEADYPTQPAMMAFKAFLAQQDDNISEEDAIKKFNEYKLDFKKEQIHEFFLAHKDEEWFRAKFHPEECSKKKEAAARALQARCGAFTKLFENGTVASVSCDTDKNEGLVRLLDAAVILMEGGTDFDLQILDPNYTLETQKPKDPNDKPTVKPEVPVTVTFNKEEKKDDEEKEEGEEDKDEKDEKEEKMEGEEGEEEPQDKPEEEKNDEQKEEPMQEQAVQNGDTTETKEEPKEPAPEEKKEENMEEEGAEKPEEKKPEEPKKDKNEKPKKGKKRRRDSNDSFTSSDSEGSLTSSDSESEKSDHEEKEKDVKEEKSSDEEEEEEEEEKDKTPRPQALHKTQSIFLRNLDPSITKQEVEAMCRQYPGFLRVGLQDPLPERRFFRRGWVTFDRTVNIKDICWNLNNIRLRDCDMGAIVNRELKQRVRPIAGITAHRPVVKADIKHAAKIVQSLDKKTGLWEDKDGEKKDKPEKEKRQYGLISRNPVLKNITDYLVDEGSYEEEAYLGAIGGAEETVNPSEQTVERDEENIQVLDRLILYLRVVHSFDFYTAVEYPSEDEMPHRCGIMHARAPAPRIVSESEITEHNTVFENKVKAFLNMKSTLSEEEAVRLGKKSEEVETEKFILANTQELAKDKWLCPLSGKKFKGPEFIRKHIIMKHNDKVDEMKLETEYFNNYLLDPKRPQLPEYPYPKSRTSGSSNSSQPSQGGEGGYHGGGGGGGNYGGGGGYQGGGSYFRPPYQGGNRGFLSHYSRNWRGGGGGGNWRGGGYRRGGGFNNYGAAGGGGGGGPQRRDSGGRGGAGYVQAPRRDRSRSDPRGIIEYRDLDAPDEADIF